MSDSWNAFAEHYDVWAQQDPREVAFYVDLARSAGGPIVELGVGTGRVAIPTAKAGTAVIGIDSSPAMLAVCRQNADAEGVGELLDLRLGDFRAPPVPERVTLVTCPFRTLLHLESEDDRRQTVAAVHELLRPGGRFAFDVFSVDSGDVDERWGEWRERTPGILERLELDWERRRQTIFLKTEAGTSELHLALVDRDEWRVLLEDAGFAVVACYGWFDRRPAAAGMAQMVWVAERRAP